MFSTIAHCLYIIFGKKNTFSQTLMKKLLLAAFAFIYSYSCYAQIKFEQGYFISNEGDKTECLIKNIDWKNNPIEFEFKLSVSSDAEKATIASVKEFGIANAATYKRFLVDIDRSRHEVDRLSTNINPEFGAETLFLKTLVEGPATLYVYIDGNIERFFYSSDGADVKQLVYKSYLTPDNKIGRNLGFRQQLWLDLSCDKLTMNDAVNISYNKKDLTRYFLKYNGCKNPVFINTGEQKNTLSPFSLSIKPGLDYSSLTIHHRESADRDIDYGNKVNYRLGVEAEYVLPFNKNKWALLAEPSYRYFKAEKNDGNKNLNVDYQSIELPLGVRHNFFLTNKSKIFISGFYVVEFAFDSKIEFVEGTNLDDLVIRPGRNAALGLGYNNDNKYSVELRYFTKRRLFEDTNYWSSEYNNLSVILGYKILQKKR